MRGVFLLPAFTLAFAGDATTPPLPPEGDADPRVEAALAAVSPAVGACQQGQEPAKYSFKLSIRPDGTVSNVESVDSGPNACVDDALRSARFPPRDGGYVLWRNLTMGPTGATFTASIVLGALEKAHIDGVIKHKMGQIRTCYRRALRSDRRLAGKVVVKFVIAKNGTVSYATTKASTLDNAQVEDCLNARFMRFVFDEPRGGGIVIVSYPFIFTPS